MKFDEIIHQFSYFLNSPVSFRNRILLGFEVGLETLWASFDYIHILKLSVKQLSVRPRFRQVVWCLRCCLNLASIIALDADWLIVVNEYYKLLKVWQIRLRNIMIHMAQKWNLSLYWRYCLTRKQFALVLRKIHFFVGCPRYRSGWF